MLCLGYLAKKSAGSSHRKSLNGHLHFLNQSDVDQFFKEARRSKQSQLYIQMLFLYNIIKHVINHLYNRTAVNFLLEMSCVVLVIVLDETAILDMHVDMNFLENFSI